MLVAAFLTLVLVVTCVFIHYEVLRVVSSAMERMTIRPRNRLLIVIAAVFLAHIREISLFALTYWGMDEHWQMGALTGATEGVWLDWFYFSAASYTTLGMGDVFPSGDLRLLTAVESLAGLTLIGWSTSFTYLAMRKFWILHAVREHGKSSNKQNPGKAPGFWVSSNLPDYWIVTALMPLIRLAEIWSTSPE